MFKKIILILSLIFITYIVLNNVEDKIITNDNLNKIQLYYQENTSEYIGLLEIPKINLLRGFYSYNHEENDVDKNIYLVEQSDMPDVENGLLILASHSGNSKVAFFNELDLLKEGDKVIINYNNQEYIYYINSFYNEPKDGYLKIIKDNKKSTIALITCNRNNKNYQTIYIGYRSEVW